ncbi:MAG: hypothetical protein ACM34K_10195 [Bacillota bacterium]
MRLGKWQSVSAAILICIFSFCCSSSEKNASEKNTPENTDNPKTRENSEITNNSKDSLSGYRSGNSGQRPDLHESLAPGSARVKASVQDFSEKKDSYICTFKIEEVEGYGPATPPLPVSYILKAVAQRRLLENNNYSARKLFQKGKILNMSISYQGKMFNSDSLLPWIITGFYDLK